MQTILPGFDEHRSNGARGRQGARPPASAKDPDERARRRWRRREIARQGWIPLGWRGLYTEGECASLSVLGRKCRFGMAKVTHAELADLAGVSLTTLCNALRKAEHNCHLAIFRSEPGRGGRSKPNGYCLAGEWLGHIRTHFGAKAKPKKQLELRIFRSIPTRPAPRQKVSKFCKPYDLALLESLTPSVAAPALSPLPALPMLSPEVLALIKRKRWASG